MRLTPRALHFYTVVLAILVVAGIYAMEPAINQFVRGFFGVGRAVTDTVNGKAFVLVPFTIFLAIRSGWYLVGLTAVRQLLRREVDSRKPQALRDVTWLASGLVVGISVMAALILAIVALNGATIAYFQSNTAIALGIAVGWIGCSLIGAAAEEILYRGMILSIFDRIAGRTFAVFGSALLFSLSHIGNPGVSKLWLLRLFLQGLLLAWAVGRTGSLWWSIGYHAGWNFSSAPLFGTAESGYGADGHLFNFVATGPVWLTGGEVGPEGSALAFLAMMVAASVLLASSRGTGMRGQPSPIPDIDR